MSRGGTGSTLGPRAICTIFYIIYFIILFWGEGVGPLKWWAPGQCPIAHMASPPLTMRPLYGFLNTVVFCFPPFFPPPPPPSSWSYVLTLKIPSDADRAYNLHSLTLPLPTSCNPSRRWMTLLVESRSLPPRPLPPNILTGGFS